MQRQEVNRDFSKIPHKFLERLMSSDLTGRQIKVALALARIQFGYHQSMARVKLRKISEMTGVSIANISREIRVLIHKKFVVNPDNKYPRGYKIIVNPDKKFVVNPDNKISCKCKSEAEVGNPKEKEIKKVYINPPTPQKKPAGNLEGRIAFKNQKKIEPKYIEFIRDKVEEKVGRGEDIKDREAVVQYHFREGTYREEFLDHTKMDRYYKRLEKDRVREEQRKDRVDRQDREKKKRNKKVTLVGGVWIWVISVGGYPRMIVPGSRWESFKGQVPASYLNMFKYFPKYGGYMIDN